MLAVTARHDSVYAIDAEAMSLGSCKLDIDPRLHMIGRR